MSLALLIVLRLLHIVLGVFWVGAVVFIAFLLFPSVRESGPAGGAVMQRLMGRGLKLLRVDPMRDVRDLLRRHARILRQPELRFGGGAVRVIAEVAEPPPRAGDGDVAEVDRVEGEVTVADPERLSIGMPMELVLIPAPGGNGAVTFAFTPVEDS